MRITSIMIALGLLGCSHIPVDQTSESAKEKVIEDFLDRDEGLDLDELVSHLSKQEIVKKGIDNKAEVEECRSISVGGGFFLTANHCFKSEGKTLELSTYKGKIKCASDSLEIHSKKESDLALVWCENYLGHESTVALLPDLPSIHDIAVYFPLDVNGNADLVAKKFPQKSRGDLEENSFYFFGYVQSLPGMHHWTTEDISEGVYLADLPSKGGYSGSAVFIRRDDEYFLGGILSCSDEFGEITTKYSDGRVHKSQVGSWLGFSGPENIRRLLRSFVNKDK